MSTLELTATVSTALIDAGIDTMSKMAFACSFQPGQADEKPFIDFLTEVRQRPPTVGEKAVL